MHKSLCRPPVRRFSQIFVVIMALWVTQSEAFRSTYAEDTCSYAGDEKVASESVESDYVEELCGWGTHDSGPVRSRTASSFESSLASVAATACASTGISFEQIAEPFAMVGPRESNSLASIAKLQQWWESAVDTAIAAGVQISEQTDVDQVAEESIAVTVKVEPEALMESVDTAEIDEIEQAIQQELDAIAMEEPIDVDTAEIDEIEQAIRQELDAIAMEEPIDADTVESPSDLVGSAPMIVTIDDTYYSYDLAARDLRMFSLFPLATRPFCVRSRIEPLDVPPMWNAVEDHTIDASVVEDNAVEDQILSQSDQPVTDVIIDLQQQVRHLTEVYCGSPDCLLDEWVWVAGEALQPGAPLQTWLQPAKLGEQIAVIASKSSSVATEAVDLLATVWPQTEPKAKPTAGQALLARAEAVETAEPIELTAEGAETQIAEAVPGNSLR